MNCACGGQHFGVLLQRDIAIYRERVFQPERAYTANGMTGNGHHLITAEHARFRTERVFELFVIQTRVAFRHHQDHLIFNLE